MNYRSPLVAKLEATRAAFTSSSSQHQSPSHYGSGSRDLHQQALRLSSANRPSPLSLTPTGAHAYHQTQYSPGPQTAPAQLRRNGERPRTFCCFLCGAQFGSTSILIHIAACKRKWEMAEEVKPVRERRPLPPDPPELLEPLPMDPAGMDIFNSAMFVYFDQVSLVPCGSCGRTFRPDALDRHSKVCDGKGPGGRKHQSAPYLSQSSSSAPRPPTSPAPSSPLTRMKPNANPSNNNALRPSSSRQSPSGPSSSSRPSSTRGGGGPNMLSKPRGYNCFLCGAQFGSASLLIHIVACKKKWDMKEEVKPMRERRRVPPDPPELLEPLPMDPALIDNFNARMLDVWSTASLINCPICTRSFRPDAFERHSKMCTHSTPGGPHGLPSNVKAPQPPSTPQTPSSSSSFTPKAYTCYLCGRGFGHSSLSIHLPQCLAKWCKSEGVKAPHERREPPPPPPELDQPLPTDHPGIHEFNAKMEDIFNSRSLLTCPHCRRTMNEKAFSHHSKACTAEHPTTPAASRQQAPVPPSSLNRTSNQPSPAQRRTSYHEPDPPPALNQPKPRPATVSQPSPTDDSRLECQGCGRRFTEAALATHGRICAKIFGGKKRRVFDSSKHRRAGTDMEAFAPKTTSAKKQQQGPPPAESNRPNSIPRWKQQSEELRAAMRAMREVKDAMANGRPLPPPPVSAPDPSLVQCPHCGRRFNEVAAARHIPSCKTTVNKPKFLKAGTGGAGLLMAPQAKALPTAGHRPY